MLGSTRGAVPSAATEEPDAVGQFSVRTDSERATAGVTCSFANRNEGEHPNFMRRIRTGNHA